MSYAVMIIEDEVILAKKIAKYLAQRQFDVRVVDNGQAGLDALAEFQPDAVVLDFNLPGDLNGLEVLKRIRAFDSGIKVILATGHGNVRLAVDAIKAGAYDYLSKPIVLSELKLLLDRAIGESRKDGQISYFQEKQAMRAGIDQILGASESISELKDRIVRIVTAGGQIQSGSPPAVLITGETGAGKELVARALHFGGARSKRPFIELNVATIPTNLVESELFGYERGAFTDARERKLGLVEAADGGTLFLDEIGELHLSVQAKLLKLLEDQAIRRLGSVRDHTVNIQIVTATNRSLSDMVEEGTFREDLYYRLNTLSLEVPPLRLRTGDIALLTHKFVEEFNRKYGKPTMKTSRSAVVALEQYSWPGNVRELRNVIEQAVLHCDGEEISVEHFTFPKASTSAAPVNRSPSNGIHESGSTLPEVERDLIARTLQDVDGNVSKAARRLGISRDRLRYRIEKYKL